MSVCVDMLNEDGQICELDEFVLLLAGGLACFSIWLTSERATNAKLAG